MCVVSFTPTPPRKKRAVESREDCDVSELLAAALLTAETPLPPKVTDGEDCDASELLAAALLTAQTPLPPKVTDVRIAATAAREETESEYGSSLGDDDVDTADLAKRPAAVMSKAKAKPTAKPAPVRKKSAAAATIADVIPSTPSRKVAKAVKSGDISSTENVGKPVIVAPPLQVCRVQKFSTRAWGLVKQTVASKKSYIQYYDHDAGGKWKCVFSTTNPQHEKFTDFISDQMMAECSTPAKIKDLGHELKTGGIKLPANWRDEGILFGGESVDSMSLSCDDVY